MTLVELIKKLQEINNDSINANKPIKVYIEEEYKDFTIDISEVVVEDNCIELKWKWTK